MKLFETRLKIKPISANKMFGVRGRRTFKTSEYLAYQNEVRDHLVGTEWPFGDEPVCFHVEGGLSSKLFDLDNVIKPLLDTLQGIYPEFNDNKVYYIELHKEIVPKGEEYLWIRVRGYTQGIYHGEGDVQESFSFTEDESKAAESEPQE